MEKLTLEQSYSLASGHFLTDYIPVDLLEDDDTEGVDDFIREHMTEAFEYSGWPASDLWELIEAIGMDYYKLTNSTVNP